MRHEKLLNKLSINIYKVLALLNTIILQDKDFDKI